MILLDLWPCWETGRVIMLQGISQGMQPPPPLVTTLTTLCCIGLVVWTFISQGKSTAALAIAALLVLSLQLLATEKPRFAQLTSSVFGLFYCGECVWCKRTACS